MNNRERMLTAYRRRQPDVVPVSPELWYDVAVALDADCTWQDVCLGRYPLWRAQLAAHRHFGSAAWLIAAARGGAARGEIVREETVTPEGELELRCRGRCAKGELTWRSRSNATFDAWPVERPIKDMARDLPAFETLFMPDPATMDVSEVREALSGVGGDGIVTAYAGSLFFSFIAAHMEGGPEAAILAMLDEPRIFEEFQARYIAHLTAVARRVIEAGPEILLLDNGYSTTGIISPALYARWDLPVIRAVAEVTHKAGPSTQLGAGRVLHLHQHGRCRALMDMIVAAGADLVDPFERPPSGDTPDLGEIKRAYGGRIAIRGNMHAHETLLRGTPEDVEREAAECIRAAAAGGGFILASGDGVIAGTPEENIFRMVEAGERYGKY